ncbi:MAG: hypothetical protein E7487_03710 [Ruminococcaceae bacterium]|nr:hypothetical protein [Oscillospiraceae bacterium]
MSGEMLFEVIGEIEDHFVTEENERMKGRRVTAKQWAGLAACMVLVVAVATGILWSEWKGEIASEDSRDELLEPIIMAVYKDAYYEVVESEKILERYHLPNEITLDMVGECFGKVTDEGNEELGDFYRYLPYGETCDAVYLLSSDGIHYRFALFCNFIHPNDRVYEEASVLFGLYGVDTSEDIASMTVGNKTVTDRTEIEKVYTALCEAEAMGNHDFQRQVFEGRSEEEQQKLSGELADNNVEFQFVTRSGAVIKGIRYYKTISYFAWSLNYYRITAE